MYINYPEKFTVNINYVHNILEPEIKERRSKPKKNKNIKDNYEHNIYRILDDEYANEQTS